MMKPILRFFPSRKWLVLPPILLGAACVAGFVMSKKELPRIEPVEQVLSLPVLRVQATELRPWATGFGTAFPSRTWAAVTEVKGRIVETHSSLDSGQRVNANALLLRIDDSDYQLRLDQRRADLNSMEAKLAELEAGRVADNSSLELAKKLMDVADGDLKRIQQLHQNNAASESELGSSRSVALQQSQAVQSLENALTLYPSRIASAKASVAMAASQVQEAQLNIDRTVIRSPICGVLSGVDLEPGQIVGQNQRLFEIQDDQVVEIKAQFSLAQLEKVYPRLRSRISSHSAFNSLSAADGDLLEGLTANVSVRSGDITHRWVGKPVRISESVNEQTRTLGIVIQVSNGNQFKLNDRSTTYRDDQSSNASLEIREYASGPLRPTLRSGSFCEVTLFGRPIANTITIPRTAIDGDVAYIIDKDSRLRVRRIETGVVVGDEVTVTAGLNEGDRVAVAYPVPAIEGKLIDPQLIAPAKAPHLSLQSKMERQR
jgi:multidrug efflux pump subunit AcrA (membrane-fusion protein)